MSRVFVAVAAAVVLAVALVVGLAVVRGGRALERELHPDPRATAAQRRATDRLTCVNLRRSWPLADHIEPGGSLEGRGMLQFSFYFSGPPSDPAAGHAYRIVEDAHERAMHHDATPLTDRERAAVDVLDRWIARTCPAR